MDHMEHEWSMIHNDGGRFKTYLVRLGLGGLGLEKQFL